MLTTMDDVAVLLRRAPSAAGYTAEESSLITDHLLDCALSGVGDHRRRRRGRLPRRDAGDRAGDREGEGVGDRRGRSPQHLVHGGVQLLPRADHRGGARRDGRRQRRADRGPARQQRGPLRHQPHRLRLPHDRDPRDLGHRTSETTLAEVLLAHRLCDPLPEGKLFDPQGNPSTTPMDLLGGALTVWGGHRGSGLALVVQMLGALAGASYAPDGLTDCGFLLVVIDPAVLTDADDFRRRTSAYADSVRAARPLNSDRPVRMPFDRSVAERERRRAAGVLEIADEVHAALTAIADGSVSAGSDA